MNRCPVPADIMSAIGQLLTPVEQAALRSAGFDLRSGAHEVGYSDRSLRRGRAALRMRYQAPTWAEAVRRHQMTIDESSARLDRLERSLEALGGRIEEMVRQGSSANGRREVERSIRRIEEEFSPDELQMVRDHRGYEQFRRFMDRYADELDREAREALGSGVQDDDEEDDEPDEDEGEGERDIVKPKPRSPRAHVKPPGRHDKAEPAQEEKPKSSFWDLLNAD